MCSARAEPVEYRVHQLPRVIDTDGPLRSAVVVIIGAIAELARNLIIGRVPCRHAPRSPRRPSHRSQATGARSQCHPAGPPARPESWDNWPRATGSPVPPSAACSASMPQLLWRNLRDRSYLLTSCRGCCLRSVSAPRSAGSAVNSSAAAVVLKRRSRICVASLSTPGALALDRRDRLGQMHGTLNDAHKSHPGCFRRPPKTAPLNPTKSTAETSSSGLFSWQCGF